MTIPEIDIIGAGNLASSLAPALEVNGYIVNNVYGRSLDSAKEISDRLYQSSVTDNLDLSNSRSTVFFLCIADDFIEEVARELVLPDGAVIAHTSGSRSLSILGYTASANVGVFYPLQTFSKSKRVDFKNIPILVEGDNKSTEKVLLKIAKKISGNASKATSNQRRKIHLAAVFASNFTNSLLIQATELLKSANYNPDVLAPLIIETINKSFALGPELAQTGPASRGDLEILDEHLQMLEDFPDLQATYKLISQQILDRSETD